MRDVVNGAALRVRKGKGQSVKKVLQVGFRALRPLHAAAVGAQQTKAEREKEKLLKDEAAPRDGKCVLIGRKVDIFIGVARMTQRMGEAHVIGQNIAEFVRAGIESLTDRLI